MIETPLVPVRSVLRKIQPSCGEWFYVAGELLVRPRNSEVRTFPAPIGLCLQARRCEVLSPYEHGDPWARVYATGEREWVQVERIAAVFRDEDALYRHLWPEFYKDDAPTKPTATSAGGAP